MQPTLSQQQLPLLPTFTNTAGYHPFFHGQISYYRELPNHMTPAHCRDTLTLTSRGFRTSNSLWARSLWVAWDFYLHLTTLSVVDNFGSSFGLFSDISSQMCRFSLKLFLKTIRCTSLLNNSTLPQTGDGSDISRLYHWPKILATGWQISALLL